MYRKLLRFAVMFLVVPCSVVAQASAPPRTAVVAQGTSPEIAGLFRLTRSELSGDRARNVVAFMEKWFRATGNTGYDASLDHVVSLLRAAGYVRKDSARASDRLVYRIESRPLPRPAWDPADASFTIAGERSPVMQYSSNRNMLAINSWSTPDSGIAAPLISAGRGTAAELDSAKVAGKIVVAEAPLGQLHTEAVIKRGAAGVMAYRMPAYLQPAVHINSVQFTSIPYDTVRKSWGIALSKRGFDALRTALARGPVVLRVSVKARHFPSTNRTVIAEVLGSTVPDERFVFSAHVQEPGANDNASGVGALAEIARVLGKFSQSRTVVPKRTITMLFGSEIQQTQDFLASDSVRTRGVRWGLSLDMVGEDTKKTGGTFLIEKMPDPSAIWTRGEEKHSEWGGDAITRDRLRPHYFNDFLLARCLDQSAATGWVVKTNPFEGGSDHTPFLQHNKPGVLFWHFTDVFYHTDGDRLENVSPVTLANTSNCALVSALTLTNANGETARSLIGEVERAALRRLDVEMALSRTELAKGGTLAKERDILETWTDYYVKSLATMQEIEVGGSSAETLQAITASQTKVQRAGRVYVEQLTAGR